MNEGTMNERTKAPLDAYLLVAYRPATVVTTTYGTFYKGSELALLNTTSVPELTDWWADKVVENRITADTKSEEERRSFWEFTLSINGVVVYSAELVHGNLAPDVKSITPLQLHAMRAVAQKVNALEKCVAQKIEDRKAAA
jgi:hypothetical protein